MTEFTRRNLMETSVAAALGASVAGVASGAEEEDGDTALAPSVEGEIERLATTALGAEVTGPFVTGSGTLIFSLQHPSRRNPAPFNKGGIGYVKGHEFGDGEEFDELSIPTTEEEQGRVRVGEGEYELLAQEGDNIGDNEELGMPVTPNGLSVDELAGSRYFDLGFTPDMNQFVPTDEDGTEGYLFTNFETSPGNVTRMPISRDEDGAWSADLENTVNLANTEELRRLGGTRINCYGDLSPWGTPVSAEEEYAHTRASLTATVSEMLDEGTGVGRRGGVHFWNRPNPTEIQEAVDDYYGDDSWYIQGSWALGGVELLAYYLGADPIDQADGSLENTRTPLREGYPNCYRTGYIVDFREPEAETPRPVKYYVCGRAAWEAPDFQEDRKTVYLSSDGDNKGFYKFVADEEIPSYDDPMDIEGTLYAAKVTNQEAAAANPPGEVSLEVEWLALSRASNREVASWIAEYDGVTQVDYLETHADTDWQEDLEAALEEADREVVENGNQDYISDEEIAEWGELWSEDPESTVADRGRDDLRRVPFLETRAAAKEIGATVEFRKSEGIDSVEGAGPGDYIYVGISEVNDGMSDDAGDVQMDRVDGGLVYRAEIEADYDISTLEPVIVGPDATDPADVANDALLNIDNVYVMDDGRVLCCEDADQFGRSYPNDCLYVYTPDEGENGDEKEDGESEAESGDDADADGESGEGSENEDDAKNGEDVE
jgi:secreted PhoX family phosphatase